MKCTQGHLLQVLKSGAGWYIGTLIRDEEFNADMPNCRVSGYYRSREEAQEALAGGFVLRECAENDFCSQGVGCLC